MNYSVIKSTAAGLALGLVLIGATGARGKTLTRTEDPVVIPTDQFPDFNRASISALALMKWSDNQWTPIPFQIDERHPDGSYAFSEGPQAAPDRMPGLDPNDELAFMAEDAGDEAPDGSLPAGALAAYKILLTDPRDNGRAWVYLVKFKDSAPRSDKDYVRFSWLPDKKRWRVVTRDFLMEGDEDFTFPDVLAKNLSGDLEGGKFGPDVMDRIKIRGQVLGPLDLSVDLVLDEIMKARTPAWTDGPVRVLQASDSYFELGFVELKGRGRVVVTYYWNHVVWPMYLEVPDVGFLVKKVNMAAYMDLTPAAWGSRAFFESIPYDPDVVLDGKMNDREQAINSSQPISWVAGSGEQGAMMCRVIFPKQWSEVKILPFYLDDESKDDAPESNPGVSAVGFRFVGFEKLGPFSGTYYQYFYFKAALDPRQVGELLNIIDHPLSVTVN